MADICKFKLYCTTDAKWEHILAVLPPTKCPSNGGHSFDANTIAIEKCGVLINDGTPKELPLNEYKRLRYNEIDGKTVAMILPGFVYDTHTFSLSSNAQSNWNILKAQEAEFTWPVEISTIWNDAYILTQANLAAFWTAGKDAVKGHLDSGRTLKKSIYDAVDEATVDLVVDAR